MYSVLVVDDETWIRQGIKAKLKHKDLEIRKIVEAENGLQALDIIRKEPIDLIITDIRMKNMTGLELIAEAKKINTKIRYIIVSGYADFEYAKKALDLKVASYLLKPVKESELMKKVQTVLADISVKTFTHKDYLLEQRINSLFHDQDGEFLIDDHIFYSVVLLDIQKEEDLIVAKERITNAIKGLKQEGSLKVMNNFTNSNQLILIIMSKERDAVYKARKWMIYDLFYYIRDELKMIITIGVSDIDQKLTTKLYKQAKDALILTLIHGVSNIYYYREQKKIETSKLMQIKSLEKFIECKDTKSITNFISNTFNESNFNEKNAIAIKHLFYRIVRQVRYLYREKATDLEMLNVNFNEKDRFRQFTHLDELKDYLVENICFLIKMDQNTGNVKDIIKDAIRYVDQHFDEDLTVKHLAGRMGINSNYLSTLFKKETGKTFTQYLTDLRIEGAVKLLMETDANVSQIAKSVGYQDAQYFYRVFKKCTGKTPLSYRKLNMK